MAKAIFHVDADCFYASVEMLHRPDTRKQPVAVGGDVEQRHGIILTKNYLAKQYGIKTGEAIWQAKQKCPGLIVLPPNYKQYQRFSKLLREICLDYSDQLEPFGLDELWLDCSGSLGLLGKPGSLACELQKRVWRELGITVSIGVSFNKITAKLGSDLRKPCGISMIPRSRYQQIVYPLPVSDLLMVGRATSAKLHYKMIHTIGDLANCEISNLRRWFGKWGDMLHTFATGQDQTPVASYDAKNFIKSIGNSTTTVRDLKDNDDVKIILYVLAESVARRMREQGFQGRVVGISVRDNQLGSFTRQHKLTHFTNLCQEIAQEALRLFCRNYHWENPVRSIGISVSDFEHENKVFAQESFFTDQTARLGQERLDRTIDWLKSRYGNDSVQRALMLTDRHLSGFSPYDDHTIFPVSYLR